MLIFLKSIRRVLNYISIWSRSKGQMNFRPLIIKQPMSYWGIVPHSALKKIVVAICKLNAHTGYPLHRKIGDNGKINPCQGKHREFGNFAERQGILFAQVVNSLILNVKDISIFAAKIPPPPPQKKKKKKSWISLPSQFCVCNSHNWRKLT